MNGTFRNMQYCMTQLRYEFVLGEKERSEGFITRALYLCDISLLFLLKKSTVRSIHLYTYIF